jgi:hypothetical protein
MENRLGLVIAFAVVAGSAALVAFTLGYVALSRIEIRHSALIATALIAMLLGRIVQALLAQTQVNKSRNIALRRLDLVARRAASQTCGRGKVSKTCSHPHIFAFCSCFST